MKFKGPSKRFEHVYDVLSNPLSVLAHVELLNKRSEEGYELVAAVYIDDPIRRIHFYWKRPANDIRINTENLENRNNVDKTVRT